jgi:GNAT superfamily N-acetyltransferase
MIKIRNAKSSDISKIHYILNNSNELRDYEGKDEVYPMSWVKGAVTKKDNLALVAEDDRKFIGFTIVHLLRGVSDAISHSLYVAPAYRNKGIATALMNVGESWLRKHGYQWSISLVKTSNKKMQKFMAKNNFKKGDAFYVYYKVLNSK